MRGCRPPPHGPDRASSATGTSGRDCDRRRCPSTTISTTRGAITAPSRFPTAIPRCSLACRRRNGGDTEAAGTMGEGPRERSLAYDSNNVFARILRGELPCTKVYEDEHVLAFRDINPLAPTHVVIIPKGAYVSVDDFSANASEAELAAFMRAIGQVAKQEGVVDGGYRILANHGPAAHQEVPHFHLHLFGGRDLGPMLRRGG